MRDLTLPPFTDGKVKLVGKVAVFAGLHNQSDLWLLIKIIGGALLALISYYVYSNYYL
jgi:hypothetical protein